MIYRLAPASEWAWRLVALLALLVSLGWLYSCITQVIFPGDLSGWEGAIVDHIRRVVEGKPLYVQPSLDYTPLLYGPLYYWVCAALAWLGDIAFVVPRSISLVASLISAYCVAVLIRRQSAQVLPAMIGAGIFIVAAPWADSWYAFAHVDALQLAAVLLALVWWDGTPTPARLIGCGIALTAAILTKQSGLLIALLVGLDGLLSRRRDLAIVVASAIAAFIPPAFWLGFDSGVWAWHFLVVLPQKFGIRWALFPTPGYQLRYMAPGIALGVMAFVPLLLGGVSIRRALLPIVALVAMGWLGRMHPGSSWNTLMPMLAGLAVLSGLGVAWAWRHPTAWLRWTGAALVALQFVAMIYDPRKSVPPAAMAQSLIAARDVALKLPPGALILGNGYLIGQVAGSEPLALEDYLNTLDEPARRSEMARFQAELAQRGYPPIMVDPRTADVFAWLFADRYKRGAPIASQLPNASIHDEAASLFVLEPR